MKKVVIPISGGMDSAVLLYKAVRDPEIEQVHCIAFDYDQRHKRELMCADYLYSNAHHVSEKTMTLMMVGAQFISALAPTSSITNFNIDTPDIRKIAGEAQPKSYVPFRNLMFLSIALSRAEAVGATEVWHGATAVDSLAGYWDASPEFLPQLNAVTALNREHKIQVVAPLINCDKADIIKMGVDLKVPFDQTYTCYSGEEIADATSPSSSLRIQGFIKAGYKDPIKYKQQEQIEKLYEQHGCKDIVY